LLNGVKIMALFAIGLLSMACIGYMHKMESKRDMSKKPIDKLTKAIINEGLVISANKNHGKTNALAIIVSSMKDSIPVVVDYAVQHCYSLGSSFQVKFLNEKYLLRKPRIRITKPIILDMSQTTKDVAGEILRDIIKREYYARVKQVIEDFHNGSTERKVKGKWLVFAIEESQELIGRFLRHDSDLKTAMTCGRNFKISFVYLTQRIADLNTQLTERCSYLIGKQTSDNNLRKISRVLGLSRKKLKFIETLPQGQFVFYNGERIERIQFPKFEGFGRAYEIERGIINRKPKNLWQKMKEAFNPNEEEEEPDIPSVYDDSEDFDSELEEDLIIEEEW